MTKKVFTKKGKAKDIITDINKQREKADKVKEMEQLGLDVDKLKQLTIEEFDKTYTKFNTVAAKLDSNRTEFIKQLAPIISQWSFEELFVFCVDVLNAHILNITDDVLPESQQVEVSDFFPVLYDKIYNACIEALSRRYLDE